MPEHSDVSRPVAVRGEAVGVEGPSLADAGFPHKGLDQVRIGRGLGKYGRDAVAADQPGQPRELARIGLGFRADPAYRVNGETVVARKPPECVVGRNKVPVGRRDAG